MVKKRTDIKLELCPRCRYFKTCKSPCYPVENYLRRHNLGVYEKQIGDDKTMVFPRSREQHRSYYTGDIDLNKSREAFSTENESPWADYNPNHRYTAVLLQKLEGWTFGAIAEFHGVDESTVVKQYYTAVEKVMNLIIEIDQVRKAMSPEKRRKRHKEAQQKYFDSKLKRPRQLNQDKKSIAKREHYQRHKEKIKAKRREAFAKKKDA